VEREGHDFQQITQMFKKSNFRLQRNKKLKIYINHVFTIELKNNSKYLFTVI